METQLVCRSAASTARLAPIKRSAGQNTYVPVQRGDVFVARDVLSALSYAVAQHQLGGAGAVVLVQVPDPGGGVARAARSRVGYYQQLPAVSELEKSKRTGAWQSACVATHPEASRSLTGFQAQMNTSDSWPRSTVALLAGISTSTSMSIGSPWLSAGAQMAQTDANA